ncbi:hypothetical protein ACSTS3_07930 [Aquimarina muelleri]|uniref:hypothetical protein n=1 Tax=Aquimarina muelleri TaxID=279356 RepID=UPI003F6893F5
MNKIIIVFSLFTFLACSQEIEKIKINYLKSDKDFKVTFIKKDYLTELDTLNVFVEVSKKIKLQNNKCHNFPDYIGFSNDTLFGQNNNYGIGYSIFTYQKNKRINVKNFEFKKNKKYEFELIIQYRCFISLDHKKKFINSHISKKDSVNENSEYQSYLLKNTRESRKIISNIVPDSLKGYIVFNIVNKEKEHQFYQYQKIEF